MTLTATDLLELLSKLPKIDGSVVVVKNDEGYYVNITYYKRGYGMKSESIFVSNENENTWEKGTYGYEPMMVVLNEEVEKEEKERLKEQKRQELLDRLTEEERELLGF